MKEREAIKASGASKANKSSQTSYASTASPKILNYLKISFRGSEKRPESPRGPFGDPPQIFGSPGRYNNTVVGPLGPKIS